jgi:iduronate 2-sulfatase
MDMGSRLYQDLVASYETREEALKRFIQAYLASVASVDELIGNIMDVVEQTSLADNTIFIVTSDHGWGMGEKDYLYKNSLWQESTRIPLVIRAPGISQAGSISEHPVSLIDIYPTLVELCDLTGETMKNAKGRPLDGFSLKPFLENTKTKTWEGPESALTALYKWRTKYSPAKENYSLRSNNYRYIRYENGKEELYQTQSDPHEWNNLASDPSHAGPLSALRSQLIKRIPTEEDSIPNQPVFKPKKPVQPKSSVSGKSTTDKKTGEYWKNEYFKKHPDADTNGDGVLSWPERNAHKPETISSSDSNNPSSKAMDNKPESSQQKKLMSDLKWKDHFFKLNPEADANQDGDLSWPEYQKFKAELEEKKNDK